MACKLAIIIPMYDEEPNAERCVRAVCTTLSSEVPGGRLFAVDDGSRDATLAILRRLAREGLPLDWVSHERNQGYGAACLTGARAAHAAGFEFGLFMDSDLTNDPALIPRFADLLDEGRWDVVKASRYVAGGGMRGVPLQRQAPTRIGNLVASRLFGMGIRDCTNGFRAVRLSLLSGLCFAERGFPSILEELYHLKRRGARATEIPYVLSARRDGEGTSKFSYAPGIFWRYLKYALKAALVAAPRAERS